MALVPYQGLVTVTVPGYYLGKAVDKLDAELQAYPDARIVALTHQANYFAAFSGRTTVVAVVVYTPDETAKARV